MGDLGLFPGSGRSPGEGKGYPLQYSGLENSMDCIVHGVTNSQTQFSDLLKVMQLVSDFGEAYQKPYVGKNVIEFLIFT